MSERKFYTEEWRGCIECPDYEISNYAQVRNKVSKEITDPYPTRSGHRIKLQQDGTTKIYQLDELVVRAFYGDCPANHVLVHKDNNLLNSSADNLEWMPRSKAPLPKHISYLSRVRCLENGKTYDSLYECSEDLSISMNKIIKSIRNTRIGVKYAYTFELLD